MMKRCGFLYGILIAALVSGGLVLPVFRDASARVEDTKHNLSSSGPGPVKAPQGGEDQICIFCHTPHNAYPAAPLWNHDETTSNYENYYSVTLQAYGPGEAPPIDGFSKLCLGCHDGTIALGAVRSREDDIQVTGTGVDASGKLTSAAEGYLGTDLSGTHPLSFIYNGPIEGKLKGPPEDRHVKLFPTQGGMGVQCPSCHDPHENRSTVLIDGKGWPPFWQKESLEAVCLVCHVEIIDPPPPGH